MQWAEPAGVGEGNQVEIDLATREALVALMARALIAVVRAGQEDADER